MKLLVEIDEKKYASIKKYLESGMELDAWQTAVANGKPLPKGHGRLIDADAMKTIRSIQSANFNAFELIRYWIDNQPTIIEADKEVDE